MNNLLPLAVLLPLLGAGLTLALRGRPRAQRVVSTVVLSGVVVVAAGLVVLVDRYGPIVLWVGDWPEPLGIRWSANGIRFRIFSKSWVKVTKPGLS